MLSQQFNEEYAVRVPIREIKPFMAEEAGSVTQTEQGCPCFLLPALRPAHSSLQPKANNSLQLCLADAEFHSGCCGVCVVFVEARFLPKF